MMDVQNHSVREITLELRITKGISDKIMRGEKLAKSTKEKIVKRMKDKGVW